MEQVIIRYIFISYRNANRTIIFQLVFHHQLFALRLFANILYMFGTHRRDLLWPSDFAAYAGILTMCMGFMRCAQDAWATNLSQSHRGENKETINHVINTNLIDSCEFIRTFNYCIPFFSSFSLNCNHTNICDTLN